MEIYVEDVLLKIRESDDDGYKQVDIFDSSDYANYG